MIYAKAKKDLLLRLKQKESTCYDEDADVWNDLLHADGQHTGSQG